jgi:hypothetical protein
LIQGRFQSLLFLRFEILFIEREVCMKKIFVLLSLLGSLSAIATEQGKCLSIEGTSKVCVGDLVYPQQDLDGWYRTPVEVRDIDLGSREIMYGNTKRVDAHCLFTSGCVAGLCHGDYVTVTMKHKTRAGIVLGVKMGTDVLYVRAANTATTTFDRLIVKARDLGFVKGKIGAMPSLSEVVSWHVDAYEFHHELAPGETTMQKAMPWSFQERQDSLNKK